MPKLYEERERDGVKEIYLGEGEWVSAKELNEWGAEVVREKELDRAMDVLAERAASRGDE